MLQKSTILKTMEVFFLEPLKEHYLIEISRQTEIAHTSIKKNLKILLGKKIIKEKILIRGKRKFPVYIANINEKEYKNYKTLYNIQSTIENKLINHIQDKLMPKSIVLFGSYSRGEDVEGYSDIDLFVECRKAKINLSKFEKQFNRKIELHFNEDFTKYPKELKNNILNGITLSGFLEGFK
jgi:predicted nucleotidyltransferase